jgi:hypothetical protein
MPKRGLIHFNLLIASKSTKQTAKVLTSRIGSFEYAGNANGNK